MNDERRKPVSWRTLGVPDAIEKEYADAAAKGIVMRDAPEDLIERTVRACGDRAALPSPLMKPTFGHRVVAALRRFASAFRARR